MNDTKQTSKAPAFSVIMPTYNRAFCIKTAIDSLLKQTYQQFELIIVDDGSTDRTEQLIQKNYQKYLKSGKFKYIKLNHVGVSAARNVGIKEAKNEWITYLDTDNYLLSNALGVYSYNISKNPGQQNFYGKFISKTTKEVYGKLFNFEDIKKQNTIDLGVYLHTKNLIEKCGAFDETLKRFVDWEMIARHCVYSHPILIDEIVMEYNDSTKIKRITTSEKYSDTYVKAYEKVKKLVKSEFKRKITTKQKKTDECFFKIIIPNYNNMPYIQKCLDSILNQTFQDFKIVIIDDLSTDNSDKFCEMYARKYSTKIIYQQVKEKSYAGICRNIAINYPLKSKYTWAIDGDDYICDKNALKKLHNLAKNEKYDAIFFNGIIDRNEKIIPIKDRIKIDLSKPETISPTYHILAIVKSQLFGKYLETSMVGQDLYHSYLTLDQIKTYINIDDCFYAYRVNMKSMSHNAANLHIKKLREKHRLILIQELTALKKQLKNKNISKQIDIQLENIKSRSLRERYMLKDKQRQIIISMATFPKRKEGMLTVVKQLYTQCDKMYIWLNEYDKVPSELSKYKNVVPYLAGKNSSLKENGRLFWINKHCNAYYLTVDDDISYPDNYVESLVEAINRYDGKAIVSYHGAVITDFSTYREYIYGFQFEQKSDILVHRVGGGVCGFIPKRVGFLQPSIEELNSWDGDASLSVWATKHKIRKICLARNKEWLSPLVVQNQDIASINALCLNRNTRRKRKVIYDTVKEWETI